MESKVFAVLEIHFIKICCNAYEAINAYPISCSDFLFLNLRNWSMGGGTL
jgi:hypothetical protein